MGIIDQITQLKRQGVPDEEIIHILQQQGISPREINDALSQTQIKSAITNNEYNEYSNDMQGMQPSIMQEDMNGEDISQQPPSPDQQGNYDYQQPQEGGEYYQEYPQEGGVYSGYSNAGGGYQQQEAVDSDTMIEIAEQVFLEKIRLIQKQMDSLVEFKTLAETKIENISDRLKRMENIMDKLQIDILDRVGSYGKNLESIKKEMSMIEDSFSKVVHKAVESHKPSSSSTHSSPSATHRKHKKK